MKRLWLLVVAFVVLAVVAACSGHNARLRSGPVAADSASAGSEPTALALCRSVLGPTVVSGTWTTVGELRAWGYSGPVQKRPLKYAFALSAVNDPAAWCWTRDTPDTYTAWGVRPPAEAARAISITGPTQVTPSGPPRVP